jgi:hypothetical protein
MSHEIPPRFTSFDGPRRIASGPLETVALAVKGALSNGAVGPVLIFDDASGRPVDVDTRGSDDEVLARLATHPAKLADVAMATQSCDPSDSHDVDASANVARGRGRPRLGVVAREVTLLPRHWAWLSEESGGASVVLRKLVDEARRTQGEQTRRRGATEAAYHFMSAIAGDMAGFEEATRALFAHQQSRFCALIAAWPEDVRDHAIALAFGADRGTNQDADREAGNGDHPASLQKDHP